MATIHDVEIETIVDLIRAVDRDKGAHLLTTSIQTAYLRGKIEGGNEMAAAADRVFDGERLANAEPQGAA